jgi:hypothetical protein
MDGCVYVKRLCLHFQALLTIATKSTAFNPRATLSLRTLDVPPRIGHLLLQLSFFSFHHWRWQ